MESFAFAGGGSQWAGGVSGGFGGITLPELPELPSLVDIAMQPAPLASGGMFGHGDFGGVPHQQQSGSPTAGNSEGKPGGLKRRRSEAPVIQRVASRLSFVTWLCGIPDGVRCLLLGQAPVQRRATLLAVLQARRGMPRPHR